MAGYRDIFQTIWGVALFMMGIGIFFRVPYVMAQIADIEHFASVTIFIRVCFYIMGLLLIGGGIKKLYGIWYPGSHLSDSGNE